MREQVPDEVLSQMVNQRLSRMETSGRDHVTATIQSGDVTLKGHLSYEHQRRAFVQAARHVDGVRRVIDQLRIVARKRVQ
jgi:osmotically-inducible protein OsmY